MIKDRDFIKNPDVPGPTKEEVRCIVMCKSQVSEDDSVVDIGCGTGGLTVEFAKRAKFVHSIDRNHDAIKTTSRNVEKYGVKDKVGMIESDALEAIETLVNFDLLMIGGSGGELPAIIKKGYEKLNSGGRIVVTAILVETKLEAISILQDLGMEPDVVDVSIAKGEVSARGTMMLARNPITIISAEKK